MCALSHVQRDERATDGSVPVATATRALLPGNPNMPPRYRRGCVVLDWSASDSRQPRTPAITAFAASALAAGLKQQHMPSQLQCPSPVETSRFLLTFLSDGHSFLHSFIYSTTRVPRNPATRWASKLAPVGSALLNPMARFRTSTTHQLGVGN